MKDTFFTNTEKPIIDESYQLSAFYTYLKQAFIRLIYQTTLLPKVSEFLLGH